MTPEDKAAYDKRCRAPFTDAGGNCTLPQHPKYVDAAYLKQLSEFTAQVPPHQRQDFVRLFRRVFGVKVLKQNE